MSALTSLRFPRTTPSGSTFYLQFLFNNFIISYPIVSKPSSLDSSDPCASFYMKRFCAICSRLGDISILGRFRVTPNFIWLITFSLIIRLMSFQFHWTPKSFAHLSRLEKTSRFGVCTRTPTPPRPRLRPPRTHTFTQCEIQGWARGSFVEAEARAEAERSRQR